MPGAFIIGRRSRHRTIRRPPLRPRGPPRRRDRTLERHGRRGTGRDGGNCRSGARRDRRRHGRGWAPPRLDELVNRFGVPEALVDNAALIQGDAIGDLTAAQHGEAWAVNVVGAITAAAHLLPRTAAAGGGTYLITGGMPRPVPDVVSLSLGKAGVRALTELLDTQSGPAGLHVATVTVAGTVAPGTAFDPDDIAEHYWRLHVQPAGEWKREVSYGGHLV